MSRRRKRADGTATLGKKPPGKKVADKKAAGRAPAERAAAATSSDGRRRRPAFAVAEVLLWALVVLVPLVFVPTARDAFTLPKRLLGDGLALASLLALAVDAALRRDGLAGLRRAWRRPAVLAVAPLVLLAALSALAGRHPAHAAGALLDLGIGAAAVVGWSGAVEPRRLRRLLVGLAIPATLLALLAILQFHGLFRPFTFADAVEGQRFGVTSLAGNAGHLGAYLALAAVLGLAFLGTGGRRLRVACMAALAVTAYGLLVSETFTALAALAAGGLVVAALRLPPRRVVSAVVAAVVAAGLLVSVVPSLRARAAAKVEELRGGDVNALLSGRLDGWRTAAWMLRRHPVSGVGPGGYGAEFNDAKLALLDDGVPFFRDHAQPTFSHAHNEILEVGAELGWPGLAALAWALGLLAMAAARLDRGAAAASPRRRQDRAAAWGGLVAVAVLSLGHFPFRLALTAWPALLLAAWIFRRGDGAAEADGEAAESNRSGPLPAAVRRLVAWGLVLVLAVGLAAFTSRARGLLRASRILNAVEQVTTTLVARGQVSGTVLWTNLRLIQEAEPLAPAEPALPLAAGSQYLLLQRPADAIEQYRRALDLEPRPEGWLNLGRAQLQQGEREAAEESLVRAVRLNRRLLRQVPAEVRPAVRRVARGQRSGPSP